MLKYSVGSIIRVLPLRCYMLGCGFAGLDIKDPGRLGSVSRNLENIGGSPAGLRASASIPASTGFKFFFFHHAMSYLIQQGQIFHFVTF